MNFALFSLGEYSNMLVMSALNVIFFFGGWLPPKILSVPFYALTENCSMYTVKWLEIILHSFCFSFKICLFVAAYVFMRAALPRYRYDQLMDLGWKVFLPASLGYILAISMILYTFNLLPL
jgi:NADH-quinone oxidoreductase subunit H